MRTRRCFVATLCTAPLVVLGLKKAKVISRAAPETRFFRRPLPWGEVEARLAMEFYAGDQWPAEVKAKRLAEGRPCLVFNLLPGLVERTISYRTLCGKPFTRDERTALIVKTVRQTRDSQIMYNYFRTAEAEMTHYEAARA